MKFPVYLDGDDMTVVELKEIDDHLEACKQCQHEVAFWQKFMLDHAELCDSVILAKYPTAIDEADWARNRAAPIFWSNFALAHFAHTKRIPSC